MFEIPKSQFCKTAPVTNATIKFLFPSTLTQRTDISTPVWRDSPSNTEAQISSPAQQCVFVPNGFIRKILYRHLDPSGLLEVHTDGGLCDLQVWQTAKVLRDETQERWVNYVDRTWTWKDTVQLRCKVCVRAPGSDGNQESFRHGKGFHLHLPVLVMSTATRTLCTPFDTGWRDTNWNTRAFIFSCYYFYWKVT